ncbi:hypothetical protein [Microvirga rosea]|uniref:hypothetical protein n=1 Tax=Microvirga rosea TaxID=2715425 RepID=UPI001D09BFA0|nr:hypothetical protein [Microvirga rosea]MCB8819367.1 hypothetical protein [Microvirga rosea]
MSAASPLFRIPYDAMSPPRGDDRLETRVAGGRSILDDSPSESGLPPAAAARAERAFEWVGTGLFVLIVGMAIWVLIRGRL